MACILQFLQDEVDGFYEAYESDHKIFYNTADVQLVYSTASEREGSVIGGVHLELLVDLHPAADSANYPFWKVRDHNKALRSLIICYF